MYEVEPERVLYLAIDHETYAEIFYDISGQILLDANHIRLIVVDSEQEEIAQ
ncbi:MAG: hypothetical protein KDE56_11655 [Anaerolineales bacterium]|nr:hypothetical protein [Anaerolineales bacterium]